MDEWTIVNKGKNQFGGPLLNVCVEGSRRPPSTVLVADKENLNCTVTFRLDENTMWKNMVKPEFLTNPRSTKKEGIDVVLTVEDSDMKAYFDRLDCWMVSKAIEDQKNIFGPKSNLTPETLKVMYQPCIKVSDQFAPTIRVKAWLSGPEFLLTTIKIVNGAEMVEGRGWEFLKKHMGDDKLLHYKAGVDLAFRTVKVWNGNQKFSLSMDAQTIFFFRDRCHADGGIVPFGLESLMKKVLNHA